MPINIPLTGIDKYNQPIEMPKLGEEASATIGYILSPSWIITQQKASINKRTKFDKKNLNFFGRRSRTNVIWMWLCSRVTRTAPNMIIQMKVNRLNSSDQAGG